MHGRRVRDKPYGIAFQVHAATVQVSLSDLWSNGPSYSETLSGSSSEEMAPASIAYPAAADDCPANACRVGKTWIKNSLSLGQEVYGEIQHKGGIYSSLQYQSVTKNTDRQVRDLHAELADSLRGPHLSQVFPNILS